MAENHNFLQEDGLLDAFADLIWDVQIQEEEREILSAQKEVLEMTGDMEQVARSLRRGLASLATEQTLSPKVAAFSQELSREYLGLTAKEAVFGF